MRATIDSARKSLAILYGHYTHDIGHVIEYDQSALTVSPYTSDT